MASPTGAENPLTIQVPSLDDTFGALLLGTFFGLILYGMSVHQWFQYMRLHGADLLPLKFYVGFIMLLDTVHTGVVMYTCYLKLVKNYFQPQLLTKSVWPMNILTLLTGVSIVTCQSFFAYRVYRVGRKSRYLVVVCMVLLVAEIAFCIVGTVKASALFGTTVYSQFEPFAWMISVGLGIATVVDTVLAAVLIYVLHTSRTVLKKTNSMLDTLIAYAVYTGLLTDIFNILGFAFALRSSDKLIYSAFNIEVAKIYTNSVLSALNFRRPREAVSVTYEVWDLSDVRVPPMGSSAAPRSFGNVHHAKAASRPNQSTFGPLDSVIEIKVPDRFYASQTTTTTVHDDDHGHVDDVEANRMRVEDKTHGTAYYVPARSG